jgi:hypothetical protein
VIVHVPGVLYAEHGQQHHDINHFQQVLTRAELNPPGRGSDRPGVRLDEALVELAGLLGVATSSPQAVAAALVAHVRERRPGASAAVARAAALGGGLARVGLAVSVCPRRSGHAEHKRRLRDHARELGLSAEVLFELDRRATPTLLTIARTTVRSAANKTGSPGRSVPDACAVAARAERGRGACRRRRRAALLCLRAHARRAGTARSGLARSASLPERRHVVVDGPPKPRP